MTAGDVWFFRRVARVYDLFVPRADSEAIARAFRVADRPIDRVLDVAGGTGRVARVLDASEGIVLDATREMLERAPPGLGRILGDAHRLPVRGGSIDAVVIADALHHLPEPSRVVADAARVLRPGGVLVVRDFDGRTFRGRALALGERVLGMGSTVRSTKEIESLLVEADLEVSVVDAGFSCTVVGRNPTVREAGG